MTKITKFTPDTSTVASGLKDPITFTITELGPFQTDLLQQGRRVSAIPETSTWTQQSVAAVTIAASQNQILYISTSATSSSTVTNATTLNPATQVQIQSEIARVGALVTTNRLQLCSLSVLPTQGLQAFLNSYNSSYTVTQSTNSAADLANIFNNNPGGTLVPLTTPAASIRLATKGAVLDIATAYQTTPPSGASPVSSGSSVTGLFMALQQTSGAVIQIVQGNTIQVPSLAPFQLPNGTLVPVIALVNAGTQATSRNVFFFNVLNANPNDAYGTSAQITLQATTFSPIQTVTADQGTSSTPYNAAYTYLFSIAEIDFFNQAPLGTLTAVPGYPILWSTTVDPSIPTLQQYLAMLQSEIPLTALYLSTSATPQDTSGQFVGNLDLQSLQVVIHDGDNSTIAVSQGEAQAGFSISYNLSASANQSTTTEAGDVDVTIQLSGFPARLPIVGQPVQGVQGVQVSVQLGSTPQSAETVPAFKDVFSGQTIQNEQTGQAATNPTEFFFNLQITNSTGTVVGLNKYGVIKLGDSVSLLSPDSQTVLFTTTVQSVDIQNNLIYFQDVVPNTFSPGTFLQVPQSPLAPGRRYRLSVSCQDRLASATLGG